MDRFLPVSLITLGAGLMLYGVVAAGSIRSGVSRLLTGAPGDVPLWLFLGGFVASLVGIGRLVNRWRRQ